MQLYLPPPPPPHSSPEGARKKRNIGGSSGNSGSALFSLRYTLRAPHAKSSTLSSSPKTTSSPLPSLLESQSRFAPPPPFESPTGFRKGRRRGGAAGVLDVFRALEPRRKLAVHRQKAWAHDRGCRCGRCGRHSCRAAAAEGAALTCGHEFHVPRGLRARARSHVRPAPHLPGPAMVWRRGSSPRPRMSCPRTSCPRSSCPRTSCPRTSCSAQRSHPREFLCTPTTLPLRPD